MTFVGWGGGTQAICPLSRVTTKAANGKNAQPMIMTLLSNGVHGISRRGRKSNDTAWAASTNRAKKWLYTASTLAKTYPTQCVAERSSMPRTKNHVESATRNTTKL